MTWVKLDDRFAEHPKIAGLSDRAFRSHVAAICYSARHLTDGVITTSARLALNIDPRTVRKLVDSGVWETHDLGWQIHDYAEYNPTRQTVAAERAKTRDRVAAWRARNADTDDVTNGVTPPAGNGVSNRSPSRPVPVKSSSSNQDEEREHLLDRLQLTGPVRILARTAHAQHPLGTTTLLEQIADRAATGQVQHAAAVVRGALERGEHTELDQAGERSPAEQAKQRAQRIAQAQQLYDQAIADGDTHTVAIEALAYTFRSDPSVLDEIRTAPGQDVPI